MTQFINTSSIADGAVSLLKANTDLYVPWSDYSNTSTITGWSSFTVKNIRYKRVANTVFVQFAVSGTSNSTNIAMTLPYANTSQMSDFYMAGGHCTDNTVGQSTPCCLRFTTGTSTLNVYKDMSTAVSWTASGTKTVYGQFWYETT